MPCRSAKDLMFDWKPFRGNFPCPAPVALPIAGHWLKPGARRRQREAASGRAPFFPASIISRGRAPR